MSGPKFQLAPPLYTIVYNFDSSGTKSQSQHDNANLPAIIDENGVGIMKIDPSTIVAKKGSNSKNLKTVALKEGFVDFRCWGYIDGKIDDTCVYQYIQWDTTEESDAGFY